MITAVRVIGFALLLTAAPFRAAAEDFTNALHAFLQHRVEVEKRDVALVVGLVDERGSRVVGCGKLDNGTGQEVNGDTLFEIGSLTKTFTALLLQDMVERGEMRLDDPVAGYLPRPVKLPTRHGKEITLLHLATHTSGLPLVAANLDPKRADNPYADFTVEKMYAFLSGCQLTTAPGAKYQYSELGMELLGHALARQAGTNYEALVVDRICRPLGMDSTRVTLTPELKARLARGHDELGYAVPGLEFQTLVGGSGLRSTANDLLKYLAANLGLTPSPLTPLMEKTHVIRFAFARQHVRIGLGWFVYYYPQGRQFIMHGGGTPGYTTFLIFDPARRRGAVILASSNDLSNIGWLGRWLLESEWEPDRRPEAATLRHLKCDSYAGEYQLVPNMALGLLTLRAVLANVPKAAWGVAGGLCAAVVLLAVFLRRVAGGRKRWSGLTLRWRAFRLRHRRSLVGGAVLLGGAGALLTPLIAARVACALTHPVMDVRREGDRLFVQCTGSTRVTSRFPLPHLTGELLPQSDTRCFERLSGVPMTFARDAQGRVTRVTAPLFGARLTFAKISDQAPALPQPRAALRLDPKLWDPCVGQYEFAPDDLFPAGVKLTLRRQGDRLVGQAADKNGGWGAFDVYPVSATNCFFTLAIVGVQLSFIKNDQGEVTSVRRQVAGWPDREGRKLNRE